ncbi:hypothetical protein D3C87_1195400 [compost metagenome]
MPFANVANDIRRSFCDVEYTFLQAVDPSYKASSIAFAVKRCGKNIHDIDRLSLVVNIAQDDSTRFTRQALLSVIAQFGAGVGIPDDFPTTARQPLCCRDA